MRPLGRSGAELPLMFFSNATNYFFKSEHFKKRENARILNKKRQHFQKSDKCDKATNAKIARQTTTIKRQKCPFVGIRQKRKTLFKKVLIHRNSYYEV